MTDHQAIVRQAALALHAVDFYDAFHGFFDEGDDFALLRLADEVQDRLAALREAALAAGGKMNACEICGAETSLKYVEVLRTRSKHGVETSFMEFRCSACPPSGPQFQERES